MPYMLQMNTSASLMQAAPLLRSAPGKLSHCLLSNGQNAEECDARDDAMKNYRWYQKNIFYLSNRYKFLYLINYY
jgi:hypothetical protein